MTWHQQIRVFGLSVSKETMTLATSFVRFIQYQSVTDRRTDRHLCSGYISACIACVFFTAGKNPTPSIDAYLFEEQSCQVSCRSNLKQWSLSLFKEGRPNKHKKLETINKKQEIWHQQQLLIQKCCLQPLSVRKSSYQFGRKSRNITEE